MHRARHRLALASLAASLAGQATVMAAYAGEDQALAPAFVINTQTDSDQGIPLVASDAAGNMLVVWSSSGDTRRHAQRFAPDGSRRGTEFLLDAVDASGKPVTVESMAMDADGDLLLVGVTFDDRQRWSIQTRRFGRDGQPLGPVKRVYRSRSYMNIRTTPVSMAPDGRAVIAWVECDNANTCTEVKAQRISAGGAASGDPVTLAIPTDGNSPAAAIGPDGSFFVVWMTKWSGNPSVAMAQAFDPGGAPIGVPVAIDDRVLPYVVSPSSGELVAAWDESARIWTRRISASTGAATSAVAVSPPPPSFGYFTEPRTAFDAAGNLVFVWSGSDDALYARQQAASGEWQGDAFPLIPTYPSQQPRGTAVAMDADGDWMAAWQAYDPTGHPSFDADIVGRRYRSLHPIDLSATITGGPASLTSSGSGTWTVSLRNEEAPATTSASATVNRAIGAVSNAAIEFTAQEISLRRIEVLAGKAQCGIDIGSASGRCRLPTPLEAGQAVDLQISASAPSLEGTAALTASVDAHVVDPQADNDVAAASAGIACSDQDRGTIRIDDSPITAREGTGGVTIGVVRDGGACGNASAALRLSDGTAHAGKDYVASPPALHWSNGEQGAQYAWIGFVDDDVAEPDESFSVSIGAVDGAASTVPLSRTVTIVDDDPPPKVSFERSRFAGEESQHVQVTVELNSATTKRVDVPIVPTGTATPGSDFSLSSRTLHIPAGSRSGSVDLALLADHRTEGVETIVLELGTPTNAQLGRVTRMTIDLSDAPAAAATTGAR